tara:strand:+ start:85 stop:552 length:468 start_codon:yes stop_codon:yes gene_type:complete
MNIDVSRAAEDDKPVVRRLLELNSHDFSEFDGRDLGPHGEYGYRYLDHYWAESDQRRAYLIRADGQIAGCALVRLGAPHEMAEFFIVKKYRRSGVGTVAAREVFALHDGAWSVHEVAGNRGAVAFWRRAIPMEFAEESNNDGTTQTFVMEASADA